MPIARSQFQEVKNSSNHEKGCNYMAGALILPKDAFWADITEADYFNLALQNKKAFVYRMAQKYNAEPTLVFRRIAELKVLMGEEGNQ